MKVQGILVKSQMGLIPRQTESNANPKKGNSKSPNHWKEHFTPKCAAATMGFVQAYTPFDRTVL